MTNVHPLDELDQLKDQYGEESEQYKAALLALPQRLKELDQTRKAQAAKRQEHLKRMKRTNDRMFGYSPGTIESSDPDYFTHERERQAEDHMKREADNG